MLFTGSDCICVYVLHVIHMIKLINMTTKCIYRISLKWNRFPKTPRHQHLFPVLIQLHYCSRNKISIATSCCFCYDHIKHCPSASFISGVCVQTSKQQYRTSTSKYTHTMSPHSETPVTATMSGAKFSRRYEETFFYPQMTFHIFCATNLRGKC